MNAYTKYFFGTPKRLMVSCIVIAGLIVIAFPNILKVAVDRIVLALTPLLGPALALLIVVAGIKYMLKK